MKSKTTEQANELYLKFAEEAVSKEINEERVLVWEGKLVETCLSLGIAYGSYRKVIKRLEEVGAIQRVNSGNRGTPTMIFLLNEPTGKRWEALDKGKLVSPLTEAQQYAKLLADVREYLDQLGGMDIGKVLLNFEQRIKVLEETVSKLASKPKSNTKTNKESV